MLAKKEFTVIIERDESGWFIADVPQLHGCHTQGKTKKEVLCNIKEAISLCLEVQNEKKIKPKMPFVSVEKVSVYA
ncbi:MAG: type II toxin-antitoxin system HicB family antitoxin [Candidatus Diapherotrites archaeon]|nr:type II toxin-antitoxin system HicB family antitoxin [Candidatus Diapherotrites archaeon]